jgi:hypothetical protein
MVTTRIPKASFKRGGRRRKVPVVLLINKCLRATNHIIPSFYEVAVMGTSCHDHPVSNQTLYLLFLSCSLATTMCVVTVSVVDPLYRLFYRDNDVTTTRTNSKAAMILVFCGVFACRWCGRKVKVSTTQPLGDLSRQRHFQRRCNNRKRTKGDRITTKHSSYLAALGLITC